MGVAGNVEFTVAGQKKSPHKIDELKVTSSSITDSRKDPSSPCNSAQRHSISQTALLAEEITNYEGRKGKIQILHYRITVEI